MPPARDPLVRLTSVSRVYQEGIRVAALTDVNLTVSRGEYLVVTGTSGSGKSTLLNIVGLLDRPTSGIYELSGVNTAELSQKELARLRSRSLGFVFQAFHLLAHRTALDNVLLGSVYQSRSRRDRRLRAAWALDRVGLDARADAFAQNLSGGERQRVAIARALASDPEVLVCDEPTGNLDAMNTQEIFRLIDGLVDDGHTVIVATHDDRVSRRGNRHVVIEDGRVVDQ